MASTGTEEPHGVAGSTEATTSGQPAATEAAEASGQLPAEIEYDQNISDEDSAFGDDAQSMTTSVKSSIYKYKFENGRRYHAFKDGSYWLPNDESELDRLDLYHHVVTLRIDDKLHLAPIGPEPQRILDIGTGTGIWAIEMGDLYPSAEVLGNDLSPVQPSMVPPNVTFEIDDVESDWLYSSGFDYIHSRYMAGAIKDWPRLVSQAFKFLKPGGWVEFHDFAMRWYTTSGEFEQGCLLDKWTVDVIDGIKKVGIEPEPGPRLEGWVREAGFVNVTHKLLPIPTGMWPKDRRLKEIGACDLVQFLEGMEAISFRILTGVQGYSHEEVQVLLAKCRNDLKNTKLRLQHDFHVVYAQKPFE